MSYTYSRLIGAIISREYCTHGYPCPKIVALVDGRGHMTGDTEGSLTEIYPVIIQIYPK